MSVSSVGCCGQLPFSLPHASADVHPGWSDGDLNYKPEGDWLALFFDDERNSVRYGGQVTVGHAVGGVCPFALPENVAVYLDVSMKRFDTIFPAAGSSNSAVEMTCQELEQYSSNFAAWVDVCKGWE